MALKTTLITGATSGIGRETTLALAKRGYAIYMLVRDTEKGEQLKEEILAATGNNELFVVKCDLADLKSVRAATDLIKAKLFNVQLLINNAGGIFNERQVSTDGFEMTFALNHLGHFFLTACLMPLLQRGHARIINVSSDAHKLAKPDFNDLELLQKYSSIKAYSNSKLFNIWFTKSLAERYQEKGINAFALHPGVVRTGFGADLSGFARLLFKLSAPFMITAEKGAQTTIYLSTEPRIDNKSGLYFKNKQAVNPSALANNQVSRNKLWAISEELVKDY